MIDEKLSEIFKVKGKAQFPKIYRTYDHDCIPHWNSIEYVDQQQYL